MGQTEGRPALPSHRLSHIVSSQMRSGKDQVPFVFEGRTFPRFVAVDLLFDVRTLPNPLNSEQYRPKAQ